jgi:polyisoprenoid-binding protein YceI
VDRHFAPRAANVRTSIAAISAAAGAILLTSSLAAAGTELLPIDKNHSLVGFRIRHFVSSVEGRFRDFDGSIVIDRQHPSSSGVELTIQAASIDTGDENRDRHLKSGDFFDVAAFPRITFRSTKVVPRSGDAYDVTGTFTMHGVTKSITVPVQYRRLDAGMSGFETLDFTLDRKDYGITWNQLADSGGLALGNEVHIHARIQTDRIRRNSSFRGTP